MKSMMKNNTKEKLFPKLMQDRSFDTVVLFDSSERGQVVYAGSQSQYILGWYHDDFDMSKFIDFNGKIELSND